MSGFLKIDDCFFNLDLIEDAVMERDGCRIKFKSGDKYLIRAPYAAGFGNIGVDWIQKAVELRKRENQTHSPQPPKLSRDPSIVQRIKKWDATHCVVFYSTGSQEQLGADVTPTLLAELDNLSIDPNGVYLEHRQL